jgi:hypothetical protein
MRLPREFTDIRWGTGDGFRRVIRYKTSSDGDWTTVDLTAATAVNVYLLAEDDTTAAEFEAVGADSALFTLGATGVLVFEAAAGTFSSSDVGAYNLWIKVTDATWAAGKVFVSPVGIRIVGVDVS